jgi:hypothetical protein
LQPKLAENNDDVGDRHGDTEGETKAEARKRGCE